jgi:predicted transcriptional regulator
LSIRPRFVERILAGEKTVELRRGRPRIEPGQPFLIYCTVPVKALTAVAWTSGVLAAPPVLLWQRVSSLAGVSREEFDAYFAGAKHAFGLQLASVSALREPLALSMLKKLIPGFHPPQSFRYFTADQIATLRVPELAEVLGVYSDRRARSVA